MRPALNNVLIDGVVWLNEIYHLGVRQRTVRQQSTMDKSGTLPIFLYNNTQEESYDPVVDPSYQDTSDLLMDEHPDDIPVVSAQSSSTRSGRKRRAPKSSEDMVLY